MSMTIYLIIIKHKELDEKCYIYQLAGSIMLFSLIVSLIPFMTFKQVGDLDYLLDCDFNEVDKNSNAILTIIFT